MTHSHHSTADAARPEGPADAPLRGRRWLNLGVLAHVDAGKTSLTEALLYARGAVSQVGRVDDGTLADEYGVQVDFRATTVICVERPAARASAMRRLGDPGHRYGYPLGVTVADRT